MKLFLQFNQDSCFLCRFISVLFFTFFLYTNSFSQCNAAWPTVSGGGAHTIVVDSRVATGTTLSGSLVVNAGITLCTEGTAAITVTTLTNNGTINHTGSGAFSVSSTVVNSGTITSAVGFTKTDWTTDFTNNAGAGISAVGNISIDGRTVNSGTITSTGGTGAFAITANRGFTVTATGVVDISGNITTAGTFNNSGRIISQTGAFTKTETSNVTIGSGGSITTVINTQIEGTTVNSGTVTVTGGSFTKSSWPEDFTNNTSGVYSISGDITIGGVAINSGTITSTGGSFTNNSGASEPITNNSTGIYDIFGNITMVDDVTNAGQIISRTGTYSNLGAFTNYANISGGVLQAFGNISINGTVDNCGKIEITNSGVFAKTDWTGDITNSDGSTIRIRSAGSTSTIQGNFFNNGLAAFEGPVTMGATNGAITNASTGYLRICGQLSTAYAITNSGTIEVLGQVLFNSAFDDITNNSGAIFNITDDLDVTQGNIFNYGCTTIGDSLWRRNSTFDDITISGGTIFTANFIQDDGNLIGGGTAGARGYLDITGISATINGVPLSNYLDLCDHSGAGAGAKYLDTESPAYTPYPVANKTDCGSSPTCTKATFVVCGDPLPPPSNVPCSTLMPVEFIEFTTTCLPGVGHVQLNWITATETNNDFFLVERSNNGIKFEAIGSVKGAGNSSSVKKYSFVDTDPLPGTSYYRLKQTDFNGSFQYTKINSVNCNRRGLNVVLYPNPGNGQFVIEGAEENSNLIVYNVLGEKIFQTTISAKKSVIDLSRLAKGVYLVRIDSIAGSALQKLVIQ